MCDAECILFADLKPCLRVFLGRSCLRAAAGALIECILWSQPHPAPLAGRRVVELGTMLAAPFAAHILSQLGAEVIKVEPPRGDPTRSLVRGGPSGTFIAYSHGKKS